MRYFPIIAGCLLSLANLPVWAGLDYRLTVDIRPPVLDGTVEISSDQAQTVEFDFTGLQWLGEDGTPQETPAGRARLDLLPGQPVKLRYAATLSNNQDNFVDQDNVFLTRQWYPRPDQLAQYHLELSLPVGFIANSEAEQINFEARGDTVYYRFDFPHPLDALHLAASRDYQIAQQAYVSAGPAAREISLQTYFFSEDAGLAGTYLEYARRYLALYENLIGPYPYPRFAIVENRLPSGYSMPTYTLLGQSVARLPFIVETSLGHEILHQWFGNLVYVAYEQGNWAEGLVNYLADQWYAAQAGQGAAFRKRILLEYQAYVKAGQAFPLKSFISRENKLHSAIGYGKGAMLFHGLRLRLGDKVFFNGLRSLIQARSFQPASWQDVRAAFPPGADTDAYFAQGLERADISDLRIKSAHLSMGYSGLTLDLTLAQNAPPYALEVPLAVYAGQRKTVHTLSFNQAEQSFTIPLDDTPTRIVLDEDYDLMRALAPTEIPPILAQVLAADRLLAVIPPARQALYLPLLEALGVPYELADPAGLELANALDRSLVLAGDDNPLIALLLGRPALPEGHLAVRVLPHPRSPFDSAQGPPAHRILLLRAVGPIQAAARKLPHYGQYSALAFDEQGKNILKETAASENGFLVLQHPATRALQPDTLGDLAWLLPRLQDRRVVLIGEQHDRYAHHLNQLAIIRALKQSGQPLAIGLEMFQKPAQAALDAYIAGSIEEKEMLRRTGYYDTWRFDYSLYKPILDYARENKIPLLALNVPGEISKKIAREGLDSLTPAEKTQLPDSLDFSDARYREDLQAVFSQHQGVSQHQNFEYFVQAQTVWDETMAETASVFLRQHPEHRLVILAGNGHLRYRYGIPQRLHRRMGAPYAVLAQDEALAEGIADYVLASEDIEGRPSPLLGVALAPDSTTVESVTPDSPADKAGLQAGDTLVELAGEAIQSLADIKIALLGQRWGDRLKLAVERQGERLEKDVELFDFHGSAPGPR